MTRKTDTVLATGDVQQCKDNPYITRVIKAMSDMDITTQKKIFAMVLKRRNGIKSK